MILKTGQLFHIDFGYIFNQEPPAKLTTPIRFTIEMVQAMGGVHSEGFREFCRYCTLAYNLLRKHTSLIMNLLALMVDAGFGIFAKMSPAATLATVGP